MDGSKFSSAIERKPIRIVVQSKILSLAFLLDGQHFVNGDDDGKIRCWWMEDGKEVGTPMNVGSPVRTIAVSRDGKWIVAGTESGQVVVWDAESRKQVNKFKAHKKGVNVLVDVSPDGTKIATGSDDKAARVWSLPDGTWLKGWRYDEPVHTVKFSSDGGLLAVGAECEGGGGAALRIYEGQDGRYLGGTYISARSVAWANDNQLFALSSDGNIHCLDASSQATISRWPIHANDSPRCISVSSNCSFVAVCANSSVSFWDTVTHEQVRFVIRHPDPVACMAVSPNHDLVIAGSSNIALWDLRTVLPTPYIGDQVGGSSIPWVTSSIHFVHYNRDSPE